MRMPELKYSSRKTEAEIDVMRGLNFGNALRDGDMAEALNISARKYPYLTVSKDRAAVKDGTPAAEITNCTALTQFRGKLVTVRGTKIYYDGDEIGSVTAGAKQFAAVNTKLAIFPDKKYIDFSDMSNIALRDLGADITVKYSTDRYQFKVTPSTQTVTYAIDPEYTGDCPHFTDHFRPGDAVRFVTSNAAYSDKEFTVKTVHESYLTAEAGTFSGAETGFDGSLVREIPDLDFICESENRLWGVCNADRTIYASALGDPTNFHIYQGLSTDSYAVAVGSDGDFTAVCSLGSSVLCFKERYIHKVLGSYPAEYSVVTYNAEGVAAGSEKSLVNINGTVFYVGAHGGVYAYSGGTPRLMTPTFGEINLSAGVAGTDGERYYLSCKVDDATAYDLFVYDSKSGIWTRDDDTQAVDFTRIGNECFFAGNDGKVYLTDAAETGMTKPWLVRYTPFYETVKGRKCHSALIIRLELPKGSFAGVYISRDGGPWTLCGTLRGGTRDAVSMRLPIGRCDRFELKLSGEGPCTLLSILREMHIGSEV